jgi:hypothetical protein
MPATAPLREARTTAETLDERVHSVNETMSEILGMVADLDEQQRWREDGATNMPAWLAGRYGLAWATAKEWVRVAHAVRALPNLADAHRRSRLSWDQLRPLTCFVTSESEDFWTDRGAVLRPWSLWREAKRHERAEVRRSQDARQQRSLTLTWDHDHPLLHLEGTLPTEEGAAVQAALERKVERGTDEGAKDVRMADALVELVTRDGEGEPAPATLVVHTGVETLAGKEPARGPWLAETAGGQRLDSEAVRRLACDARVEWVSESKGRVAGLGKQGRVVPGPMHRILRHRDGGCRFPGCERKQWLHAHHLIHWADGGTTTLENLALLCHAHHRLIHEGGWRVTGRGDGILRFHDPRGRELRVTPAERRDTGAGAPP